MLSYPDYFPNRLKPIVAAAVMKAQRQYRDGDIRTTERRVKEGAFAFAEIGCKAAEDGEWRVDLAQSGIEQFVHLLCIFDIENNRSNWIKDHWTHIKLNIINSDEWLGYLDRLAAVADTQAEWATIAEGGTSDTGATPSVSVTRKETILKILEDKGMTRSRWAAKAGVDPSVVYDYLEGKSNPRADSRKALAEVLGLRPSELPE